MTLRIAVIFSFALVALLGCDSQGNELEGVDERVAIGEAVFTVEVDPSYADLHRVVWTGDKLWATTNTGGSSTNPQALLHLDPQTGDILETIPTEQGWRIWTLSYANGYLLDIDYWWHPSHTGRFVNRFDETGTFVDRWYYHGQYEVHDYLTFGAGRYWAGTNFECDGLNCQATVSYTADGQVRAVDEVKRYQYMTFGGGHFWASVSGNVIHKLDADLGLVRAYEITDNYFPSGPYAGMPGKVLFYMPDGLWIMDRFNNFFRTGLE